MLWEVESNKVCNKVMVFMSNVGRTMYVLIHNMDKETTNRKVNFEKKFVLGDEIKECLLCCRVLCLLATYGN